MINNLQELNHLTNSSDLFQQIKKNNFFVLFYSYQIDKHRYYYNCLGKENLKHLEYNLDSAQLNFVQSYPKISQYEAPKTKYHRYSNLKNKFLNQNKCKSFFFTEISNAQKFIFMLISKHKPILLAISVLFKKPLKQISVASSIVI